MRGLIADLPSPFPLAELLPTLLREDRLARDLCAGLDQVLAPILLTLDSFPAYLDLSTTPDDMLGWLAGWAGLISPEQSLPAQGDPVRLRALVRTAQQLHVLRGTRTGIERAVTAELDVRCEVAESGETDWSDQPDQPLPTGDLAGESAPTIEVTVYPRAGQSVDPERLDAVLAAATPVFVRRRVRIMPADQDRL